MYFFDGTSDLGPHPPWRRMRESGMPRALHSDAGPARMQCNDHFRPGGGHLLRLPRVFAKTVRSREVEKPAGSQLPRESPHERAGAGERSHQRAQPEPKRDGMQQIGAGVCRPEPIGRFNATTQTLRFAVSEMQISVTEDGRVTAREVAAFQQSQWEKMQNVRNHS